MTIPMKKTVKKATEADIGKYVFATDSTCHPSVQQVEKGCTDRGRKLAAVIPDEYSPEEPFITVRNDGSVSTWRHVYIIHEEPVPYTEGQGASGLKPGDWVMVTRKAATGEGGWAETWPEEMDRFVGSVGKVDRISSGSGGIFLAGCGYYRYPYFVLEKITTRPACTGDAGKKCIHNNNEHTIDTIFQSSDGKLWAALKSASGVIGVTELEMAQVILDQPQVQATQAARPSWLPDGWRVMKAHEVIKAGDKVQANYTPGEPCGIWTPASDSIGKQVMHSAHSNDVWITPDAKEEPRPSWLPEGWRQLGPDEVITSKDKVQSNYHPDLPRSANASNGLDWAGAADSSSVSAQVGKKVSDSQYPKDIWIRKVE